MTLLTRAPDLRQAQHTSIIEDIRVWVDRDGAHPGRAASRSARRAQACRHAARRRIRHPWADRRERPRRRRRARRICRADRCLRPHPAAPRGEERGRDRLCARGGAACRRRARRGHRGNPRGRRRGPTSSPPCRARSSRRGGDYPANEFIIGSGPDALLCRYKSGRRRLDAQRPDHARIRRRLSPLPCRADADDRGRRADAAPPRPARRGARGACRGRGGDASGQNVRRRVRCARGGHGRAMALPRTGSTPAATASAPASRRAGWTGRCSIAAIRRRSSPAWCSSRT